MEKILKGGQSYVHKSGLKAEIAASAIIHQRGIPLLLSSVILRERGAGQVDVARIESRAGEQVIALFEIKSKWWPNAKQWQRLKKSSIFLSQVLCLSSTIRVWVGEEERP